MMKIQPNTIVYTCPECGGKLKITEIEPGLKVRQCAGCTAIYEIKDPKLLPYAFTH